MCASFLVLVACPDREPDPAFLKMRSSGLFLEFLPNEKTPASDCPGFFDFVSDLGDQYFAATGPPPPKRKLIPALTTLLRSRSQMTNPTPIAMPTSASTA